MQGILKGVGLDRGSRSRASFDVGQEVIAKYGTDEDFLAVHGVRTPFDTCDYSL